MNTQSIIRTDKHGNITRYGEYYVNPKYNLIDMNCKHGLHLEYYNSKLVHYTTYTNNIKNGVSYGFVASISKDNTIDSVRSYTDGIITHDYSVFPSGNLRSYNDCTTSTKSTYNHHGTQIDMNYTEIDTGNSVHVKYHSNGRPKLYQIDYTFKNAPNRNKVEYTIMWDKTGKLSKILAPSLWWDNSKSMTGLSASIQDKTLQIMFFSQGEDITTDVIEMCFNPLAITLDENALIQLAHPGSNCFVPELFQYELAQAAKKYPVKYGI